MAKLSNAEIIEAIKELSILELRDLVKECEEEFGVVAAGARLLLLVELLQVKLLKKRLNLM